MCKNLKIKFIITIIAIVFLALVIPSITNKSLAVGRFGSEVSGLHSNKALENNSITWDKMKADGQGFISGSFFKLNKFTFCIQHGTDLSFTAGSVQYSVSNEILIDGSTSDVLNGLAYILNQDNSEFDRTIPNGGSGDWNGYQNDPVQLALWAYLSEYNTDINKALRTNKEIGEYADDKFYFPSQKKMTIDTSKKYIDGETNSVGWQIGGNNENGRNGYTIFKNAEKAKNGTDKNIYTAKVYILAHYEMKFDNGDKKWLSQCQKTMLVEETDKVESAPLGIKITKKLDKGTSDKTFEFSVKFTQNGEPRTIKHSIKANDSANFKFETADLKNNIKVEITETSNDRNYDAMKKITVSYYYDSTSKKWRVDQDKTVKLTEEQKNYLEPYDKNSNYVRVGYLDNYMRRTEDGNTFELIVKNKYNPIVNIRFIKQDFSTTKKLSGAKIKVEKSSSADHNIREILYQTYNSSQKTSSLEAYDTLSLISQSLKNVDSSNHEGWFRKTTNSNDGWSVKIKPKSNNGEFKLNVTELVAPDGYNLINKDKNPITLTVEYNTSTGKVKSISVAEKYKDFISTWTSEETGITYIKLKNKSNTITNVNLYKKDTSNNNVNGAEFSVELTNVNSIVKDKTTTTADTEKKIKFTAKSNSSGLIANISKIVPKNNNIKTIDMTITETKSAPGTAELPKALKLQFTKNDSGEWKLEQKSDNKLDTKYFTIADNVLTVTLKDDTKIDKLQIKKVDTATGQPLKGAEFKITSLDGVTIGNSNTVTKETKSNGLITLQDLLITDNNNIEIEIEETKAPDKHYKMSPNPITVKLKRGKNNTYTILKGANYVTVEKGVITITLKDDSKEIKGLQIEKKDKTGKYKVKDAEFQLFFNQIESIKFVGDDKTYTLAEVRKQPTVSVDDGTYMSNGSVYKMTTTGGYTLISPIRDDGDADRLFIEGLKTNAAGEINSIEYVVASKENKTIYLNIKETKTSSGWAILPDTVRLLLHYDSNNHTWKAYKKTPENLDKFGKKRDNSYYNSKLDDYVDLSQGGIKILLKDDYQIDKFSIAKTDTQNNEKISGAKFNVTLNNIKSVLGYEINSKGSTTLKDIPGNTVFKDLVITDPDKPVVITIEETKAPTGYKRMEGKIKITLTRDGSTFKIDKVETIGTVLEEEFVQENTKYSKNNFTVGIKNIPIINLGGIVWEDAQSGVKNIKGPDGKLNNGEKGMAGIGVEVYNSSGTRITTDAYGKQLKDTTANDSDKITYTLNNGSTDTITLSKGEYIFPNLPKGTYYIKFLYNGINYKTVECCSSNSLYTYKKEDKESKVTEVNIDAFNARFKTISKGQSNDGTKLGYDYDSENKISKLQVGTKGENPANGNKADFQMTAVSSNYLRSGDTNWKDVWTSKGKIKRDHYALDINCGLTEKYFDLSLGTDVKSARVTINGKEKTYTYAQVMDGALEDLTLDGKTQNNSSGTEYTLYLYYSDYNFRIADYKTDMNGGITNKVNDKDDDNVNYDDLKELEVYVTYSIILKNQSKHEGTVEKFDYYYDSKYTIYEIPALEDYTVERNDNEHKITFTHKGTSTLNNENDYRRGIEVTFKVNKNEQGYVKTGEFSNAGEITVYSTPTGGVIDYDSAPDNAEISTSTEQKKITRNFEDDCDEAPGLKISAKEDLVRKISGNVFEDLKEYNGNKDANDPNVNDVIVQLIEIKKINGKNYEYIWQETRSGSNEVRTTTKNGYDASAKYTNAEKADGKYQFKDFIPGNYIVRFIYGDGTTYDLTDNVKKYNGQDYKSTIDEHYKEEWYNSTKYDSNSSVAVDNEARRLETMEYSTTIDKDISTAINEKTENMLSNTWMCAETSKLNVGVEENTSYENMNFGLAQRPNTKLVLEKHITSLKITPQGVGVQPIVEARLDINTILDSNNVTAKEATGLKQHLAIMTATREERGFWKVETDIEEIAQGAKVELEYTYVIKNEGEKDYLSSDVIGEYTTNIGKDKNNNGTDDYVDYLKGASGTAKASVKGQRNNSGNYLGQYYYTGTKGTNDASVLSTVTKIEDNLNNDLNLANTTESSFAKVNEQAIDKQLYNVNGVLEKEKIETVLGNTSSFKMLDVNEKDTSKTAKLETTLAATKEGIRIPTYLEEITEYTNAAGRKDIESTPGNLSYVHSEDTNKTMNTDNEVDEFWGETIIVSKPTGEDKQTPVQAIIIATTAIATIGVGIILIKKFVLKK